MEKIIARINELAQKAKTPEGLTAAERAEQATLRKQYLENFRAHFRQQLDSIVIQEQDGSRHKLTKKS